MIMTRKFKKYILAYAILLVFPLAYAEKEVKLDQLQVPAGFHINVFASGINNARKMALGDNGTVFVGSTDAAKVYAIIPDKNSPNGHKVMILASGLYQPQGVAFYKGNLYVAEIDRIIRYDNIEQHLDNPPPPKLITNNFPIVKPEGDAHYQRHGWKSIKIGPDNKLYVALGSPCDSCISKDKRDATIMRMDLDGSNMQVYAQGVRNSVGFDWDPISHNFWFTDNGRDYMGDNVPPDKLNYAPTPGLDFGFPYYHGLNPQGKPIADPQYGKLRSPQGITWPAFSLPAHVAVLGMVFYNSHMFPTEYTNQIFMAEHGSWNRSSKVGYRVSLAKIKDNKVLSYTPFITGWEKNDSFWGRPVDFLIMPDGALLVSDDYTGVIYRITYQQ